MLYGFLAREGIRKEEAAALEWSDARRPNAIGWIDLARGWVYLEKHKTVKTSGARDWPLDPGVADALRRWRALQPTRARYVFSAGGDAPADVSKLAREFRADVRAVGVIRPELFATTGTRRMLCAHDLRGTFVTIALAAGRSEAWIARRTGHRTSAMIAKYQRHAANLAEGSAVLLEPLGSAIPELQARGGASSSKAAISSHVEQENAAFDAVELMGIEPTASRVRF